MAQITHETGEPLVAWASNCNITITTSETIALDGIGTLGFRNIAITIFNHSSSANQLSASALYGSPDGINYIAVNGYSSSTTSVNGVFHTELTCSFKFLRLTITSAGTSSVDAYLYATP